MANTFALLGFDPRQPCVGVHSLERTRLSPLPAARPRDHRHRPLAHQGVRSRRVDPVGQAIAAQRRWRCSCSTARFSSTSSPPPSSPRRSRAGREITCADHRHPSTAAGCRAQICITIVAHARHRLQLLRRARVAASRAGPLVLPQGAPLGTGDDAVDRLPQPPGRRSRRGRDRLGAPRRVRRHPLARRSIRPSRSLTIAGTNAVFTVGLRGPGEPAPFAHVDLVG